MSWPLKTRNESDRDELRRSATYAGAHSEKRSTNRKASHDTRDQYTFSRHETRYTASNNHTERDDSGYESRNCSRDRCPIAKDDEFDRPYYHEQSPNRGDERKEDSRNEKSSSSRRKHRDREDRGREKRDREYCEYKNEASRLQPSSSGRRRHREREDKGQEIDKDRNYPEHRYEAPQTEQSSSSRRRHEDRGASRGRDDNNYDEEQPKDARMETDSSTRRKHQDREENRDRDEKTYVKVESKELRKKSSSPRQPAELKPERRLEERTNCFVRRRVKPEASKVFPPKRSNTEPVRKITPNSIDPPFRNLADEIDPRAQDRAKHEEMRRKVAQQNYGGGPYQTIAHPLFASAFSTSTQSLPGRGFNIRTQAPDPKAQPIPSSEAEAPPSKTEDEVLVEGRNCYDIFGVPRTATHEEVKKAYRKLMLKNHPDKHMNEGDEEGKAKRQAISSMLTRAWEKIKDEEMKETYDAMLRLSESRGKR